MIGQRLLHYEIVEKLGEGGMGVVYKARDTHLDRFVAIKVLPPKCVIDVTRKARFVQEAKSASALNHPNIVVVHDIASENGTDFIAMEYVSGRTLDQMVPRTGMRLREALNVAVQVADALAHAHSAGIVHRDLKPANIIVDDRGRAKILDFGLAKLFERNGSRDGSTATTRIDTDEGTVVGTAAYMSPEQAQGQAVDARADIFSFGAVLYEMATGRRAFQGDSQVSTLASVLTSEPKPPSVWVQGLPREFDRMVLRCLRKEPSRRYQVVDDLRVELEELRLELDSQPLATAPTRRRPRRRARLITLGITGLLLAAVAFFLLQGTKPPLPPTSVVPVTTYPGTEVSPSLSPDGSQVAFSWDGENQDNFDIYVKVVGGGPSLRLTTDPAVDGHPAWSPDGRSIAFLRGSTVFSVPALGGPERKVAEIRPTDYPSLSWSPDGKWLAVDEAAQGENGIFLLPVETGGKRRLTANTGHLDLYPAFSPDGRVLAYASCNTDFACDVNVIALGPDLVPAGQPRALTNQRVHINGVAWTADGRSIVYSAGRDLTNPYLWRVALSGDAVPERQDLPGPQARHPNVSHVGNRLAYDQGGDRSNIWKVEAGAAPRPFISSTLVDGYPQFSPDGKSIAFSSSRSGHGMEIWVCRRDGSDPVQLTDRLGRFQSTPRWSPDGRWIAFDSQGEDGHWHIYVIDSAGGQPRRLTTERTDQNMPSWSSDGRWIYFRSNRSGTNEIWRMPAAGGEAVQLTDNGGAVAFESADGNTLYYTKEPQNTEDSLYARPLNGGPERRVIAGMRSRAFGVVRDGIYYIASAGRESAYSVLFLDLATGKSRLVAGIEGVPVRGLAVSPDRRTVLFGLRTAISYDLMLIDNFR